MVRLKIFSSKRKKLKCFFDVRLIKIEFRDREFRFWLCGWCVLKNTHVLKDTNVKMNVLLLRKGCPGEIGP